MTDVTAARTEICPNGQGKEVICVSTATVVGATDTMTITLADFGLTKILSVYGCVHTTNNSIIVQEAVTTACDGTTLTFTTITGNDNDYRVYSAIGV